MKTPSTGNNRRHRWIRTVKAQPSPVSHPPADALNANPAYEMFEGQTRDVRIGIMEINMTTNIDDALRRLAGGDHPGLAAIDETVIARIHERRRSDAAFGAPLMAMAALGAVTLGVTAGMLPAAAAASLSPFGPSNPLAPSTLLASDR